MVEGRGVFEDHVAITNGGWEVKLQLDLATVLVNAGVLVLSVASVMAQLPTSKPPCVGDCDSSAAVTVDEILIGVNVALGQRPLASCTAFDRDGSLSLTVDELVSGVDAALHGCMEEEFEGPVVTALTLARADDVVVVPADVDALGRDVYVRSFGSGFSLIIEGRPGLDGARVGLEVFEMAPDPPTRRPDVQMIVSAALGDGSPVVCDNRSNPQGGVPAAAPFGFQEQQPITDVINEMSCRIDSGARTSDRDACTLSPRGDDFGFAFVDASSKVQFCLPIALTWAFPVGETVVAVRLRDILGNTGDVREIVVRVLGPSGSAG